MPKKYSPEELERYRGIRDRSRSGDLTSYAAMFGNSFSSRVRLLEQLIGDAHDLSLGVYKERLLKKVIVEFIPKRYEVATGFVLFPKLDLEDVGEEEFGSSMLEGPQRFHDVSKQLDLVVFDSYTYPVLFRDEDFVVLRPEAVRAIVEVKGTLDQTRTDQTVDLFVDYARKWKVCQSFYKRRNLPDMPLPGMFLMAWDPAIDPKNRPKTDGQRLRERIVQRYKSQVPDKELASLPLLRAAYLYNDCIVSDVVEMSEGQPQYGYMTTKGHLVRYAEDGESAKAGDGTIADLLGRVQSYLETPFNPVLSYVDQTRRTDVFPHKHKGFVPLLEGEDASLVIQGEV